jgi:hypothetical protein
MRLASFMQSPFSPLPIAYEPATLRKAADAVGEEGVSAGKL